jgi:hypothetical protein
MGWSSLIVGFMEFLNRQSKYFLDILGDLGM